MTTTRTDISFAKIANDITELTQLLNAKLGEPIKNQQNIQDRIIRLGRLIEAGFRIVQSRKIVAGSSDDTNLSSIVEEIDGPQFKINYLSTSFHDVIKEIDSNKHYLAEAEKAVEQIKLNYKSVKENEKSIDQKQLIEQINNALIKLTTVIEQIRAALVNLQNFKSKIPLLLAKIGSDEERLLQRLREAGYLKQTPSQLQSHINMTLHGSPQGKASSKEEKREEKSAAKEEIKTLQKGSK